MRHEPLINVVQGTCSLKKTYFPVFLYPGNERKGYYYEAELCPADRGDCQWQRLTEPHSLRDTESSVRFTTQRAAVEGQTQVCPRDTQGHTCIGRVTIPGGTTKERRLACRHTYRNGTIAAGEITRPR